MSKRLVVWSVLLPFLILALVLPGCGSVGEREPSGSEKSVQSATEASVACYAFAYDYYYPTWKGPVSEESFKSSAQCCAGTLAVGAQCKGSYCDDMYIDCSNQSVSAMGFNSTNQDFGWSPYISEELPYYYTFCPSGSVIDGIRATGSYADNVSVHCIGAAFPSMVSCNWTPWFSDEQPAMLFANQMGVASGVACRGRYCDNMSYYVCQHACSTDSDCPLAPLGQQCIGNLCSTTF